MIYLDTHVIYAGKIELISDKVKSLINGNDLLISPLVKLELQYLYEIQRLKIGSSEIIADLSNSIGLETCNKEFDTIVKTAVDITWTRDPFDRLITAQAAIDEKVLITKDQSILTNYTHAVW